LQRLSVVQHHPTYVPAPLLQRLSRPDWWGLALRTMVIMGYPVVGVLVTFAQVDSTMLTLPYRGVVVAVGLLVTGLVLNRAIRSDSGRSFGRIDGLLLLFLIVYAYRLLYDSMIADIPGAGGALFFYGVVVIVPVLACALTPRIPDLLFAKSVMLTGLFVIVLAVVAKQSGMAYNAWADQGLVEAPRLAFEALNPISLGHAAGSAMIGCLYMLVVRSGVILRVLAVIGVAGAVYILLASGSRGPFVAVGVALAWPFISDPRRLVYAAPLLPLLLFLLPFIPTDHPLVANALERFDDIFDENGRLSLIWTAIDIFIQNPFLGGSYIDPVLGPGYYPHNIIIETAMALGLVGLALLAVLLFRVMRNVLRSDMASRPFTVMLLIQQLVAAQMSGALWASDALFMLIALALVPAAETGRATGRVMPAALPHLPDKV
jgi:hypothetical protein